MDLLYFWIGTIIIFLIIEMITTTFYGLSLAIASSAVALYVWLTHETSLDIIQWGIFATIAFLSSFTLPRLLIPKSDHEDVQWIDMYIGQKRKVKKVWDALKISLDGVDYTVEWEDIAAWDQVEVVKKKWIGFIVNKVQK